MANSDLSAPVDQNSILKNPTLPDVPNRNGPLIYDVTMTPSLNGIDPTYKDMPGVQSMPKEYRG